MAHYAKIINGKVLSVIVADQKFFDVFIDNSPGFWIQTSYNTRGGLHYGEDGQPDGGVALRANYAGVGHTYDQDHDVFYAPQPFPSWTISGPDWIWKAPVPAPENQNEYYWNESLLSWVEKNSNTNT